MKKYVSLLLTIVLIILFFIGPILFPIVGIYALDNSLTILIIVCCIYSIFYILANFQKIISFAIFALITFFSVKTYENANPFVITLFYIPLFDFILMIINSFILKIRNESNENRIEKQQEIIDYENNFFKELKRKNNEYDEKNKSIKE